MNYKHFILILIIAYLSGCKVPVSKKTDEVTVVIELEKTSCMGSCPAYVLKIFNDGSMLIDAKENLDFTGLHKSQLNKKELNGLIDRFESIDFFSLNDSYKSFMMDLPTKYISYTKNGQTKRIMAYDKIPPKLTLLINDIDRYTKTTNWTKVEK